MRRSPNSYLSHRLLGLDCPEKGGKAVYASAPIQPGEILAVWGGDILNGAELATRPSAERRLTLQVAEDAYLVSTREGPADWVNHSCDPNAGLNGQIILVAMRPIEPGEEICFDYAMTDASPYDEFDCRCGSALCRGRISGADWMLSDLQARYAGYFSPYIEERIESLQRQRARPRRRPRLAAVEKAYQA